MDVYYLVYNPILFWIISLFGTWIFGFTAAYTSHYNSKSSAQALFILGGLLIPAVTAISMIYSSHNSALIQDFWDRLGSLKITSPSLLVLMVILCAVTLLATGISVLYGYSYEQFKIATKFTIFKRHDIVSVILLCTVPFLEEIAWRGYGMDSLVHTPLTISAATFIFAILWGLWHLPLFFIKDYFHYSLWQAHPIYAINFFVSLIPASFLMNWVYYTNDRSIWAAVFGHFFLNFFAMLFKTELFTKCIITVLLIIVSFFITL